MPGRVVRIDRTTELGNPFTHLDVNKTFATFQVDSRQESVDCYRAWLLKEDWVYNRFPALWQNSWEVMRKNILSQLTQLQDKTLGCWCFPLSCHGDVLIELAERSKDNVWYKQILSTVDGPII